MGFHVCEWCGFSPSTAPRFSHFSSGDSTLVFDSGRSWEVPDMILHYVFDHGWQPPEGFIDDVMTHKLVEGQRLQTKSPMSAPTRIGYLTGSFVQGSVPDGFIEKLEALLKQASLMGERVQYRGLAGPETHRDQYLGLPK